MQDNTFHSHIKASIKLGIPLVATNDVHFLYTEDFEAHEARVCINEGRMLDDPRRRRRYTEDQSAGHNVFASK